VRTERYRPRIAAVTAADRRTLEVLVQFAYATTNDQRSVAALSRRLPLVADAAGFLGTARVPASENAAIRATLKAYFESLLNGKPFTWDAIDQSFSVHTLQLQRRPDGRVQRLCGVLWPGAFWFAVVDVLLRSSVLMLRCPSCKTPFVRRGRMEYCSRTCSQNTRSAKWYATHRATALERRHAAYVRQVKRQHPRAKVMRRRRV